MAHAPGEHHEAKTHLSRLIEEALEGTEVVIARDNKPLVRLEVLPGARTERRMGGLPGLLVSVPDDFDEPLDDFAEYMR
ncbi:MAG: type II toxin-antitoxin system prevent-host-death family antitoxin [Candidatus Latescibacterota bacterium]